MAKFSSAVILDDHQEQIDVISEYLNMLEISTIGATNLKQFKEIFFAKKPELLVMDISMPDQDGFDYIIWLSENGYDNPVILMSGLGEACLDAAEALAEWYNVPVLAKLDKPISFQTIKSKLEA